NGKHMADGERSMLALFKEAAQKYENEREGILVPFNADEELNAREMFPMTRDRVIPKSLKAYANMVSSADKGGVRIIE
ncbi:MAG: hypothetical protein IJC08_05935, partial [Bacteroidaceae bacterium]|nr:hypothetical protein [Bacteroidaceae bacterium]